MTDPTHVSDFITTVPFTPAGRIIGKEFNGASFLKCEIKNEAHGHAIEFLKSWLCEMRTDERKRWVQIAGKPGRGKTHLEACCINRLSAWNLRDWAFYRFEALISTLISDTTNHLAPMGLSAALKLRIGRDVVILDDCGINEEMTAKDKEIMNAVFDYLYANQIDLVFSHNLDAEARKRFFGARIVSRFQQVGQTIECEWDTFRKGEGK